MERQIIYGLGRPCYESKGVVLLNAFARGSFLVAKAIIFACGIVFSGGVDGKKVTYENKEN